jgi:raffinose/stachyose/melibiose transport system permease protein
MATISGTDIPAVDESSIHTTAPHLVAARKTDITYYWLLVPIIVLFTIFITLPTIIGFFFSFTNNVGYGAWHFIGLTNYKAAFSDPNIRHAYGFTLLFAVTTTILVNIIALALALGLAAKIKWRTTLRGIFFIPMVISGLVIAYVFSTIFNVSVPFIATKLGISGLETSILANEHWAWTAVVIVSVWQSCPGAIIIYLAGLLTIPTEVYEAASLDGASPWQQFKSITFPLVAGYVVINSVLALKGFLNVYDVIVGTTNGGPGTATQSVAMTIFRGLSSGDYAYQMANAVIFFLVTITLSILQLGFLRRRGVSL